VPPDREVKMHADVEKLLRHVHERTGYEVAVVSEPSLKAFSTMRAASASAPTHTIWVNSKLETIADYLVAVQAAMLLLQWGPSGEVSDFASGPEMTELVEQQLRGLLTAKGASESQAELRARTYVDGLLRQLSSIPVSILAGDWLRYECPGLKDQQEAAVTGALCQNATALDPEVRENVPAEVLERSTAMNAAFAFWWYQASGSEGAILPYLDTGYVEKGQALLAALRGLPEDAAERYQYAVDSWAQLLGMVGWYDWVRRKG
jgi:hypothetical protein